MLMNERPEQTSPVGGPVTMKPPFAVRATKEESKMRIRPGCFLRRTGFLTVTVLFIGMLAPGRSARGADAKTDPPAANAPAAPQAALKRMKLPAGFTVSLFAGEPDVVQPIAMALDEQGRLWVVENYAYPIWLGGPRGKDRILIFEDADNDGRFDRRTVFFDHGTNFTGLEIGFGGIWVCATPNLLFIPDRDGDLRPDSGPVKKLDGWNTEAQHNLFNGLKWGPDGWLWGCNGILATSRVGKPGTAEADRVPINCGVWRYHPTREVFEAVAHGTTNPWGLDFDDVGEAFITNCVIAHLFHVVPGAHFQRMFGEDLTPHRYDLLAGCADHLHWAGGSWEDSREGKGKHGEMGGGHAHVGAMIYLGDNWPSPFRNDLFTCNLHGHRVNHDRLERRGSSYVAHHDADFLMAHDSWFRGLELKYGPDGAVYLTDWYDTGECHDTDADNAHRENGRIYKIVHGTARAVKVDLSQSDDEALARLQLHPNDWYVRTARRLLQERAAAGRDLGAAQRVLRAILSENQDVTRQLRAVWALHVTGGLDEKAARALLDHSSEDVRAWGVRLLCDAGTPSRTALERFAELAARDRSQKVRLGLASALQRLPLELRWAIAEPLARHREDASDRMLPLMVWYGVEPLVARDPARALGWMARCEIPTVRKFVARRAVSSNPTAGLTAVVSALKTADNSVCDDFLVGAHQALRGRKHVAKPEGWQAAFGQIVARPDLNVIEHGLLLALDVEEPKAIGTLRQIAVDKNAAADLRQRALAALVERRVPDLTGDLPALVGDPALGRQALRALAAYDNPATPEIVLARYRQYSAAERDDAIATLAARPAWALALLGALKRGQISRRDLNVSVARQLQAFGDRRISAQLEAVWGKIQPTSKAKTALVARYKALLASKDEPPADASNGRAVFNRTCLACHRLFDAGGDVGPELTGSDRANPDYILENVLDPSSAVSGDYTLTNVATTDGRLISGIIREQTEAALVIQTPTERIVLPREDVESIKPSAASIMPEGLLEALAPQEVRDLFAYLATDSQVSLGHDRPR
jgi:putative membrane-bound dehydrogenase-like protein